MHCCEGMKSAKRSKTRARVFGRLVTVGIASSGTSGCGKQALHDAIHIHSSASTFPPSLSSQHLPSPSLPYTLSSCPNISAWGCRAGYEDPTCMQCLVSCMGRSSPSCPGRMPLCACLRACALTVPCPREMKRKQRAVILGSFSRFSAPIVWPFGLA